MSAYQFDKENLMRRMIMLGVLFSVICLLSGLWAVPTARATTAIKLCGSANGLADSLIIAGTFDPSGPFVMDTDWVQFVPTVYTILGGGAVIRTIGDVSTFSGGLTVTNNSSAFGNNPTCAVSPVLEIEQSQPLMVSGTAQLRCVGGPGSPFMVTINFTLVPCNDPGPFPVASLEDAAPTFEGFEDRSHVPAAGYAPNEYRP
jgi:hypothetical protein